jgi:hypothetical protein
MTEIEIFVSDTPITDDNRADKQRVKLDAVCYEIWVNDTLIEAEAKRA